MFVKDPNAKLDYGVDWTLDLVQAESISDSQWIVPTGLTLESSPAPGINGGLTTVWLSGGTLWTQYEVTNRITTSQQRIYDKTFTIAIEPT